MAICACARSTPSEFRRLPVVGVMRHAERADARLDHPWGISHDAKSWPHDPPITANGMQQTKERVKEISLSDNSFDVIVSSPYLRCVQTALIIAEELDVFVILDYQLGELLGPSVFGPISPETVPWRPHDQLLAALVSCDDVPVESSRLYANEVLGRPPVWPESLKDAQARYAARHLTYMRRACQAQKNCLLVTHSHMLQSCLKVLPATSSLDTKSVDFCGTVLQKLRESKSLHSPARATSSHPQTCADTSTSIATLVGDGAWAHTPSRQSFIEEAGQSWWETSLHGFHFHNHSNINLEKYLSNRAQNRTISHPKSRAKQQLFLQKLQKRLDWHWENIEALLGTLPAVNDKCSITRRCCQTELPSEEVVGDEVLQLSVLQNLDSNDSSSISMASDAGDNSCSSDDSLSRNVSCQSLTSLKHGRLRGASIVGKAASDSALPDLKEVLFPKSDSSIDMSTLKLSLESSRLAQRRLRGKSFTESKLPDL
eukprot:TRINITY_DN14353_c0_g2_i3.p1 TRINITY_DN14353_c0_g2~~TRINITY_DN14353_c0_g2_i3.p1  ORF type:complete len:486 (+),score=26.02 TRINITY_DN14353_c0_g2_i3:42-1499(+)